MERTDKLILEIDQRALDTGDAEVLKLKEGAITDIDFIKGLAPESPFYIRNGVLTTVEAPAIVEEIKRMQTHMASNPPGLRVDGNIMMSKKKDVLLVFPELEGAYIAVETAINDAKCVGCARNRELAKLHEALMALHRSDHASGSVRSVMLMTQVAGQGFVDAWAKPPPAPDAPVSIARVSWAPSKNFQQVAEKLQSLQTPVSLTPPGRKVPPHQLQRPPQSALPIPAKPPAPVQAAPQPDAAPVVFKSSDKTVTVPVPPPDAGLNGIARPELPGGMRKHCYDCYGKHLMQAQVLLNETLKGYPEHAWLAVGHLAEAEDEILSQDANLADLARQARLAVMRDPLSRPDLAPLMRLCLAAREGQKTA